MTLPPRLAAASAVAALLYAHATPAAPPAVPKSPPTPDAERATVPLAPAPPGEWVNVANGLRGGEVRRHGKPDAPAVPLGGKDFGFDLVRDRAEAIPGMGQYGNTFDRFGHRFVCDNRNHLRHAVFPTDPTRR